MLYYAMHIHDDHFEFMELADQEEMNGHRNISQYFGQNTVTVASFLKQSPFPTYKLLITSSDPITKDIFDDAADHTLQEVQKRTKINTHPSFN